jgi:hypothetical protein
MRALSRRADPVECKGTNMNKTWLGIIGAIVVVVLLVWLLGGSKISCHESFWNKDKQVIEIER